MVCVEWMELHSTIYDEKVWLYTSCSVAGDTALVLPLQRVPSSSSTVQESLSRRLLLVKSCLSMALSFLSCVSTFFNTAPPPQDLLAGVLDTALLPSTGDGSPGCHLVVPLSGNQLHAPTLGPFLGSAWSPSHVSLSYRHPCH